MADKPIHFDSLEQIKKRPTFDPACIITRENYVGLAGDYGFKEDALCQVESIEAKDRPCRNKHRKGFLGRRIDGKEGLIGSTCGPKYFEGHKGFAANLASVRRELDLDNLTARLRAIATDTAFPVRVDELRERLRTVREQSQALIESLPADIAGQLRTKAKSRNADLQIDVEFVEKVENEQTGEIYEKSAWVPQTIGSIVGLSIAERASIHDLGRGLLSVRTAFESLDARRDLGGLNLTKQLKILDGLTNIETQVVAFEAASAAFARPENLKNLWLLSRRQDSQMACMRVAAAAGGTPNPSANQLRTVIRDAETALRLSNGSRRVRPATE